VSSGSNLGEKTYGDASFIFFMLIGGAGSALRGRKGIHLLPHPMNVLTQRGPKFADVGLFFCGDSLGAQFQYSFIEFGRHAK
jgi:hypothetical protein